MKTRISITLFLIALTPLFWISCDHHQSSESNSKQDSTLTKNDYGGYKNEVEYGKHLVAIIGCNDCHTPKIMTPMGPVPDTTLLLSGHPAKIPFPAVNLKEIEGKGLAITSDETAWAGPWGISYADNLTPDATGAGSWTKEQFFTAMREGKWKGMKNNRELLPPMPWQGFRNMTDNELSAIFAYLQSIKPIQNIVPPAAPPVAVPHH
ncbi:MAG: c-type cytochrome [Ginsengibacter sp.]|jgi:hypothetical protein